MTWEIRPLRADEADAFRVLRLEALERQPEAFGAAPEDEPTDLNAWAERLAGGCVFGGFGAEGGLLGMAGLALGRGRKTGHKAQMWGVYVRPAARGRGLGRALVERVVAEARGRAEWLEAGVVNPAALRLYESLGFAVYGIEPAALRVDGRDHDLRLLTLRL